MPYTILSKDILNKCELSELLTSKKGQKYAEIKIDGGQPIFQLSTAPLFSPFQAGVFQDDGTQTRLNFDLNLDEQTISTLQAFDSFFEEKLKQLAPGKSYHKLIQQAGDYPARLRTKVNTTGPHAARFHRARSRSRIGFDPHFVGVDVSPKEGPVPLGTTFIVDNDMSVRVPCSGWSRGIREAK